MDLRGEGSGKAIGGDLIFPRELPVGEIVRLTWNNFWLNCYGFFAQLCALSFFLSYTTFSRLIAWFLIDHLRSLYDPLCYWKVISMIQIEFFLPFRWYPMGRLFGAVSWGSTRLLFHSPPHRHPIIPAPVLPRRPYATTELLGVLTPPLARRYLGTARCMM